MLGSPPRSPAVPPYPGSALGAVSGSSRSAPPSPAGYLPLGGPPAIGDAVATAGRTAAPPLRSAGGARAGGGGRVEGEGPPVHGRRAAARSAAAACAARPAGCRGRGDGGVVAPP